MQPSGAPGRFERDDARNNQQRASQGQLQDKLQDLRNYSSNSCYSSSNGCRSSSNSIYGCRGSSNYNGNSSSRSFRPACRTVDDRVLWQPKDRSEFNRLLGTRWSVKGRLRCFTLDSGIARDCFGDQDEKEEEIELQEDEA